MTTSQSLRLALLSRLAEMISNLGFSRPVRIAIDGRTASGKTTFANELAAEIARRGRAVIRTSIDGFHMPKATRYARGRYSAEGYYFDARDLVAIRALLLDPLGPRGDRQYRTASFDLEKIPHSSKSRLLRRLKASSLSMGPFFNGRSLSPAGMSRCSSIRPKTCRSEEA